MSHASEIGMTNKLIDCNQLLAQDYLAMGRLDEAYSEWSQPISVDLSTGIRSEYVTKPADGKTFDLQGREVKGDARHGVYIRSGKLVLKK